MTIFTPQPSRWDVTRRVLANAARLVRHFDPTISPKDAHRIARLMRRADRRSWDKSALVRCRKAREEIQGPCADAHMRAYWIGCTNNGEAACP